MAALASTYFTISDPKVAREILENPNSLKPRDVYEWVAEALLAKREKDINIRESQSRSESLIQTWTTCLQTCML
jgi:hypothetical protein